MRITVQEILTIAPQANRGRAGEFVEVFNVFAEKFGVNTKLRAAHFIAQVLHESAYLTRVTENLNYSADGLLKVFPKYFTRSNVGLYARNPQKIGNRVYANRMGNGSEGSGDGYRYRGRGLIQLTGRSNYQAYQKSGYCNGDLMGHPEWLGQSPGHTKSALWYWWKRGLNTLADSDDVVAVTRRINGGLNGLDERKKLLVKVKTVLGL